jgi:hypothetical protein
MLATRLVVTSQPGGSIADGASTSKQQNQEARSETVNYIYIVDRVVTLTAPETKSATIEPTPLRLCVPQVVVTSLEIGSTSLGKRLTG